GVTVTMRREGPSSFKGDVVLHDAAGKQLEHEKPEAQDCTELAEELAMIVAGWRRPIVAPKPAAPPRPLPPPPPLAALPDPPAAARGAPGPPAAATCGAARASAASGAQRSDRRGRRRHRQPARRPQRPHRWHARDGHPAATPRALDRGRLAHDDQRRAVLSPV